ncbi:N-acetyl sugar amidotransferase [Pontibacter sp. E15-1]|uniref:N-acetyl sugar amidotransferase n=1 Tax=Pontibacter sp. E15-1 TaxID=2919918 RepID=UPI001F4F6D3D|nr:N-acetyl sugar amidotransferase [Pontibacter sp. E15-1]MCJ8166421.1 N-acetyl sugar amidotransferase [Pontibacter sp. E15-1]
MEHKNTQQRYNLPDEILYCKKCTVSNQRPRIIFDEEGVCSACRFAEFKKSKIDWGKREEELIALLDKHRRNDGSYDVLVPCSGGKDAAYIAHELKHKYGMNPLTVTWAPHLYTEIGWQNLHNMTRVGDLANILGTPPGETHRKLTKLAFEILGDPFQPFIYGQTNFPLQTAVRYQIPLIMYGENGEVEYGGDMKNAFSPTRNYKTDHVKHYFSGLAPEDLVRYGIKENDLVPYMAPPNEELDRLGTELHFYGYYKKWVPQENYYYCVENTGFQANPVRSEGTYSKYASLDDKIDGYHYYLAFIKFGLGRCTSDTAHEIRDGHLTREEGVALVNRFDGEFPKKYFQTFLEYCDITEDYFWEVVDSWRSLHLWEKVEGEWKLKQKVS